jgi:hypothetical protein
MIASLLAHQGGWDEILMVVTPLALLWFLLRKAKARADRLVTEGPAASESDEAEPEPSPREPEAPVTPDVRSTPPAS